MQRKIRGDDAVRKWIHCLQGDQLKIRPTPMGRCRHPIDHTQGQVKQLLLEAHLPDSQIETSDEI